MTVTSHDSYLQMGLVTWNHVLSLISCHVRVVSGNETYCMYGFLSLRPFLSQITWIMIISPMGIFIPILQWNPNKYPTGTETTLMTDLWWLFPIALICMCILRATLRSFRRLYDSAALFVKYLRYLPDIWCCMKFRFCCLIYQTFLTIWEYRQYVVNLNELHTKQALIKSPTCLNAWEQSWTMMI